MKTKKIPYNKLKRNECLSKTKNDSGITIIAVAMAVIILVILAGITVAGLSRDNNVVPEIKISSNDIENSQNEVIVELEEVTEE